MQLNEKFPIPEKIASAEKWQEILLEALAHFRNIKWLERKQENGFNIVTGGPWKVAVKNGYLFSLHDVDDKSWLKIDEKLLFHRHKQNLHKVLIRFPAEIKNYLTEKLNPNKDRDIQFNLIYDRDISKKVNAAAATIRCMTFGKSIKSRQTASLVIWRLIAKHIDYKIFSRTLSLHGYYSSFSEYNILLANKDEVERLSEATPGVVAAWLAIKVNQKESYNIKKTEIDFNKYTDSLKCESIVTELKEYLQKQNAYSTKNWKYICKLKPRWAKYLFSITCNNTGTGESKLEDVFNLLTEIRVVPRLKIYKRFVGFYLSSLYQHPNFPIKDFPIFIQRYFERSYKERVNEFWIQKMHPAIDWWVALGREFSLSNTQRKASWKWFHKKQLEWHEEFGVNRNPIREGESPAIKYEWDSAMQELMIDNYKVVPLISSDMLAQEGSDMNHCVSGYAYYCYSGSSRIFSIMKKKTKIATLELKKQEASNFVKDSKIKWIASQLRGIGNTNVESKVNKLVGKLAKIYTEEFLKNPHGKGRITEGKETPDEINFDELRVAVRNIRNFRDMEALPELNGL